MALSPEVSFKMHLETIRDAIEVHYAYPDRKVGDEAGVDFTLKIAFSRAEHLLKLLETHQLILRKKEE